MTMTMTRTRIAHTSALIFIVTIFPSTHITLSMELHALSNNYLFGRYSGSNGGGGEWMEGQRASIHLTRRHMFIQLNLMIRTLDSILGKGLGRF